jgi:hypothetical protein
LRGRIFRCVKYMVFVGALALIFGSEALKWVWVLMPLAHFEWMRFSIRRKLPVAEWPKRFTDRLE